MRPQLSPERLVEGVEGEIAGFRGLQWKQIAPNFSRSRRSLKQTVGSIYLSRLPGDLALCSPVTLQMRSLDRY